jgi:diguanylate cyclase
MDAASWPRSMSVAVNLSAVQFKRNGLVAVVENALAASGLPGERLELEVTESLLIDNRDEALAILLQLKQLGVRVAMDDFGTGYSSLSYLQSFNFDKIKIDRAFVADMEDNPQEAGIVRAVTWMGKSLNMQVVAEGVETDAQARLLQKLNCDELEGFLIAKPMAAEDVGQFIAAQPSATESPATEMAAAEVSSDIV